MFFVFSHSFFFFLSFFSFVRKFKGFSSLFHPETIFWIYANYALLIFSSLLALLIFATVFINLYTPSFFVHYFLYPIPGNLPLLIIPAKPFGNLHKIVWRRRLFADSRHRVIIMSVKNLTRCFHSP